MVRSLFLVCLLCPSAALAFGGEDAVRGHPWHHEHMTERALDPNDPIYQGLDFHPAAANAVAWHADFIDSYLYNPAWWAEDGLFGSPRLDAALAGYENLAKLHFDDIFTTAGVRDTWTRYAAGTLIGLHWASQRVVDGRRGDVAAAHHILGVSVHAVQDFYSHSNWVDDPERRCQTWFQVSPEERHGGPMYSGAYEQARSAAPHHHGAYSLTCSLISGDTFDQILDPLCGGISPYQNTSLCEEWRVCRTGANVTVSVLDEPIEGMVRLAPPGIALDTVWLSRVQAQNRDLVDSQNSFLDGHGTVYFDREQCRQLIGLPSDTQRADVCDNDADLIFAGAKDLGIRATIEWVSWIEEAMIAQGPEMAQFWDAVKSWPGNGTAGQSSQSRPLEFPEDEDEFPHQFEDFSLLGYQFLAAGPYPVANAVGSSIWGAESSHGWYLRLRVRTGEGYGDGSDADIGVQVDLGDEDWSDPILLDYLQITNATGRTTNPFLAFDDFEPGGDNVYVVGPFETQPTQIRFVNDDSSLLDAVGALLGDFANDLSSGLTALRRGVLSLAAGNADFVGREVRHLTRDDLDAGFERRDAEHGTYLNSIYVDGGDQGQYEFHYRIRDVPEQLTPEEREQDWRAVEVQAWRLDLIEESSVDRFSFSDDPFVVLVTSPLNGRSDRSVAYLSEPAEGMDDGDRHVFPRTTGSASIVKIPPNGSVVVALEIYESDDESAEDRRQLRDTFATGLDEQTRGPQDQFLNTLGSALGSDWTATYVDVYGFYRGDVPQAGQVLPGRHLGEVEGGGPPSRGFPLDWNAVRPLINAGATIDEYTSTIASPWLEGDEAPPEGYVWITDDWGNPTLAPSPSSEGETSENADDGWELEWYEQPSREPVNDPMVVIDDRRPRGTPMCLVQ